MNNYFVLFCIDADTMKAWMSQPDTEKRDQQNNEAMQDWQKWYAEHKEIIVDGGHPLGKTMRVTANGVEHVINDFNYYIIITAESEEAVAELFKNHPHLKIPSAYIEVMSTKSPTT